MVKAHSTYADLAAGSLTFAITPATVDLITTNDDWSRVASVEGFEGRGLTATHGVNPQTVLGTEFPNGRLPNTPTKVAANKSNPSAFNVGGLAEFDTGPPLALGLQGNVHANPYLVFYLNTLGRYQIRIAYRVEDIDGGSNNSVSQVALQYRVGETGNFINIPAGFIADATDGGVAGRVQNMSVVLPTPAENQPRVQVRIITTNAAAPDGTSTPDEWIGVNNVVITSQSAPTAATVTVAGRVADAGGRGICNAIVTLTDLDGTSRTATTNPFGYYRFHEVPAGAAYIVAVASKRYAFSPDSRVVTVVEDLNDVDFFADDR
ncbi:MAG: carboxypeptidase-like regulatory domain-containing protein [Pyrinomonadaceae bacterium]